MQAKDNPTKEGGSVSKGVNLQDSIIDDVGGYVSNQFLDDYCCINGYDIGPYIQKFTRKLVLLNNIKIGIIDEVVSCIKEQFQVNDSSQIDSERKVKKGYRILLISNYTDMLYDHIALTVRSHTSYVLFDDVLNSKYDKDVNIDNEEKNGPKKQLIAVMIIEEDIEMENSKKACLIYYMCVRQKLQNLGYGYILMNIAFQSEQLKNKRVFAVSALPSNYDTNRSKGKC